MEKPRRHKQEEEFSLAHPPDNDRLSSSSLMEWIVHWNPNWWHLVWSAAETLPIAIGSMDDEPFPLITMVFHWFVHVCMEEEFVLTLGKVYSHQEEDHVGWIDCPAEGRDLFPMKMAFSQKGFSCSQKANSTLTFLIWPVELFVWQSLACFFFHFFLKLDNL